MYIYIYVACIHKTHTRKRLRALKSVFVILGGHDIHRDINVRITYKRTHTRNAHATHTHK